MNTYIISYDIKNDNVRLSVANICKELGFQRIQYSVWYGNASKTKIKEIEVKILDTIKSYDANVQIFFLCESCKAKHKELISFKINEENKESKTLKEKDNEQYKKNQGVMIL